MRRAIDRSFVARLLLTTALLVPLMTVGEGKGRAETVIGADAPDPGCGLDTDGCYGGDGESVVASENPAAAIGGNGGSAGNFFGDNGWGGSGGSATAVVTGSSASTVSLSSSAVGGGGGSSDALGAYGGAGGGATAQATGSSIGGIVGVSSSATGGGGGWVDGNGCCYGGSGGGADAASSGTSIGSGRASAAATAIGGAGGATIGLWLVNGGAGGYASATSTAKSNGPGGATSSAIAAGGDGGGISESGFGDGTGGSGGEASASSTAISTGSGGASSSATATGGSGDMSSGLGGGANATSTAEADFGGVSVKSTVVASSLSSDWTGSTVSASAFSIALPDNSDATALIGGASNVADALLGPGDIVFGIAILTANGDGDSASATFDLTYRGDLLLGLIDADSVINLGADLGPEIELTFNGPGTFVLGAAVPQTPTWAMMLIGFAGLGYAGWRRALAGG